ncbi:MAG: putative sterol carrier protein [Limisphaerales bacterium]|jgi:putative sterol carrier protein
MSLDSTVEKVKEMAAKSGGFGNSIKFAFEEGKIHLDGTGEQTAVSTEDKDADCTINMKLEDFNSLMDGSLNPMTAFMAGKFKIDGDMGVAMKLQSIFS